jgi:hypothetical protein
MRCGGRFGKAFLRDGQGQGHLTEGPRRNWRRQQRLLEDGVGEPDDEKRQRSERHRDEQ